MLTVVDEFTRECLAIGVKRSQKSVDVQDTLAAVIQERGHPCYLRSDNGSEFIANSLQKWLKTQGTDSIFITPGSPWENCPQPLPKGFTDVDTRRVQCESFNGKLRDECLNMELFDTLKEAQVVIEWDDSTITIKGV